MSGGDERTSERAPGDVGRALLAWYGRHRRDLPWRTTEPDPYAVWVSEVMLQQTRAATVIPYYRRWMERFPDVPSLASADLEEVLRSWEGLGYYSRARNLHAAARSVCAAGEPSLPRTIEGLRALPGVGAYTAGAIASIAFDADEPAVDANARRVLSRYYDLPAAGAAELDRIARSWLVAGSAGDVNQAIMDLGATVCTPRTPACGRCPLAEGCGALAADTVGDRPRKRARASTPQRRFAVLLAVRPGPVGGPQTLLQRRDADGLLGGLWAFPARALDGDNGGDAGDAIGAACALGHALGLRKGADREAGRVIARVRHAYSHFTGIYEGVLSPVRAPMDTGAFEQDVADDAPPAGAVLRWAPVGDLARHPMGGADRRLARALGRAVYGVPVDSDPHTA